jgi:hypothetical protein
MFWSRPRRHAHYRCDTPTQSVQKSCVVYADSRTKIVTTLNWISPVQFWVVTFAWFLCEKRIPIKMRQMLNQRQNWIEHVTDAASALPGRWWPNEAALRFFWSPASRLQWETDGNEIGFTFFYEWNSIRTNRTRESELLVRCRGSLRDRR